MNNATSNKARQPLVILIPYLKRTDDQADLDLTVQSLLSDSYQNWDLLLVDDGSPVPVEIRHYGLGKRVLVLIQPTNKGIEEALNRGVTEALKYGYTYIARIDAGDEALNDRLAKQVDALDNDPELTLVSCFAEVTDQKGNLLYIHRPPIDSKSIHRQMAVQNWIVHTGVSIRSQALQKIGLYRTDFKAAEDYELFCRVLFTGYKARTIPEVLVRFDTNPSGISGKRRRQQLFSTLRVQLKYFDLGQWRSYYGVLRTSLLFLIPRRWALRIKKALS